MTIQQLNSLGASLQTIATASEATLHRLNQDERRLLVRISSTYRANADNLANIAGTQDATTLAHIAGKLVSTDEQPVPHSSCIWRIIKAVLNLLHLRTSATTAYTAAGQLGALIPPPQNREEHLQREAQKKEPDLQEQEAERRAETAKRAQESEERVSSTQVSNEENPFLQLPGNIHQTIVSFLPAKDAASVAATCKSLAVLVKEAKAAEILLLIQCAKTLNDAISKLPEGERGLFKTDIDRVNVSGFERYYDSFYFDLEKWNLFLQNIGTYSATKAVKCAQECYLDLVEALAEYNVRSVLGKDETERIIDQIELPDQQQRDLLSQILEEARHTLTGRLYLRCEYYGGPIPAVKINNDWYSLVRLRNREHMTYTGLYDRFLRFCRKSRDQFEENQLLSDGNQIKTERLKGKKEGDRIILSCSERGGDERVILRCSGSSWAGRLNPPMGRERPPLFEEVLQESLSPAAHRRYQI